jgi:predicted ArsR family transcriptional regulator
MANQLAQDLDMHRVADATHEERLTHITDFLTEQGYLARWERAEEEAEGVYFLHKHNCPYAGVSEEHDELCLMDQELVNRLMGQQCDRTQSLVASDHCCTYRIELQLDVPSEDCVPGKAATAVPGKCAHRSLPKDALSDRPLTVPN